MRSRVTATERGQVAVGFISLFVLVLAALAIGYGITSAFALRQEEDMLLQSAQEFVIAQADYIKHARDGAGSLSASEGVGKIVSDYLGSTGASGRVTIEVVEMPRSMTGNADRIVGVRLAISHPLTAGAFSYFGVDRFNVASSRTFVVHPYSSQPLPEPPAWNAGAWWSSESTWRDGNLVEGTTASSDPSPYSSAPSEIVDAMEGALARTGI
ncbi:MAG: hypothetical protein SOU51_01215 [Collinsella sp.]|nr:hypothetical protein [Collinsella sp.]